VLLPRNDHQEHLFRSNHPEWFEANRTVVPPRAIDGLNLLWFSDLVVSGGGTMNREAAALGVPVYSIFRGKKGNVDRMLEREGRLVMIQNPEEVWKKIRFASRKKPVVADLMPQPALQDIISHIEDIIRIEQERSRRPR
jgi:predicted glycosyltransferase